MKNSKLYYLFSTFLIIFSGVCCKQNKSNISQTNTLTKDLFWGDSMLAKKSYFKAITFEKEFSILEKQNKKYLREFSYFNKNNLKSTNLNNVLLKLVKENSNNIKEVKVNLYTYKNGKKTDSLDFYRNISRDDFGRYNCMSYFDQKHHKIWQIKYFPSIGKEPSNIISYSESTINSNGKIKLDSLHYIDESLDVEMDKYNLYY
jgi:hypothetical protein